MASIDRIAFLLTFALQFQIIYLQISNACYVFLVCLPLDSPRILETEAMEPNTQSKAASKRKAYISKRDEKPSVASADINSAELHVTPNASATSSVQEKVSGGGMIEWRYIGSKKLTRPSAIHIHWVPPPIPALVHHSSSIVKYNVNEPASPLQPEENAPSPLSLVHPPPILPRVNPKAKILSPARVHHSSSVKLSVKTPLLPSHTSREPLERPPSDSRTLNINDTTTKDQLLICDEDIEPYTFGGAHSSHPSPERTSARKLPAMAKNNEENTHGKVPAEKSVRRNNLTCVPDVNFNESFHQIPNKTDVVLKKTYIRHSGRTAEFSNLFWDPERRSYYYTERIASDKVPNQAIIEPSKLKDKSDDREDEETEEDDVSDDDVSIAEERGNDESGFSEDEKTDDKTVDGKNEVALPVEKRIYFRDSGRTPQSSFVRWDPYRRMYYYIQKDTSNQAPNQDKQRPTGHPIASKASFEERSKVTLESSNHVPNQDIQNRDHSIADNSSFEERNKLTLESCMSPSKKLKLRGECSASKTHVAVEKHNTVTSESCMPPSEKVKLRGECSASNAHFALQRIQGAFPRPYSADATTPLRSNTTKRVHQQRGTQAIVPGYAAQNAGFTSPLVRSTTEEKSSEQRNSHPEKSDSVAQYSDCNTDKTKKIDRINTHLKRNPDPDSHSGYEKVVDQSRSEYKNASHVPQSAVAPLALPGKTSKGKLCQRRLSQSAVKSVEGSSGGGPSHDQGRDLSGKDAAAAEVPWIPAPVVHVDRLTYDWSSLKLDGTAAWSTWKQEWLFQNAVTLENTVPSTSAMDMFRFVTALKREVVQTTEPAPASPMINILPLISSWRYLKQEGGRKSKKAKSVVPHEEPGTTNEWLKRCTSMLSHTVPEFCADQEMCSLIPRAAVVYYEMLSQQSATTQRHDERIKKYQYMTAAELQDYVQKMEQDVTVTLVERERRILRTAEQLRLYPLEKTDRMATPSPPPLVQDDFSALLQTVPSSRKRKRSHVWK